MMPPLPVLVALSLATAGLGAVGGLGGAVFLVPALVLAGVEPQVAAPLGILSVGAGSLAAAPAQLREGVVHHRLGVTLELAASLGVIAGALAGDRISAGALRLVLALTALAAAATGLRRQGLRNVPDGLFSAELAGEWAGTLGGAYRLGDRMVPYQARRVPQGLVAMGVAGVVSGLAGVGGGFIKTPALREIMGVPVKVAAATTTFTVGITTATALVVFSAQGRLDERAGAAVVVGGLAGGWVGAAVQRHLPPERVRVVSAGALAAVGMATLVTA